MSIDISKLLAPKLVIPTRYDMQKHFIVVGAGGTGGYLIPNLARQVSLQNKIRRVENLPPHKITIIDADGVEEKNLTRQQFVLADIGKNKAEVMANRYGRAFELAIEYLPEYISSTEMLLGLTDNDSHIPVFIDCVDNNKTRAIMFDAYSQTDSFMISSGNEEYSGQVVFSRNTPGKSRTLDHMLSSDRKGPVLPFRTPTLVDMFTSVLDGTDRHPSEMSCAENAVSAPQNIMTNMTAANIIFGFVNKLLMKHEDGQGIQQFAVFFNTQDFNTRVFSTSAEDFKSAMQMGGDNERVNLFFGDERVAMEEYRAILEEKPTGVTV